MAEQKKEQKLLIDLDKGQHATALSEGALIYSTELNIFYERIQSIVRHIPSFKKQLENTQASEPPDVGYERYHDVITIHGKRGSGKTTFLLSALSSLKKRGSSGSPEGQFGNLCVLDIMDPTLFGLHDHLLHSLLGKIAQKVRKDAERHGISLCDGINVPCLLEKWEKSLRGLAKGLKYAGEMRDDLKSPSPQKETIDWMDAEFLMEKGMDTANHGVDLERAFHRFLNDSLTILGKDAFVLGLDDIDTRPSIGWHVLEVLRRYFTTPQLIVVIAGDLDLFKTLIEKQQLSIFGLDFTSRKSVLKEFQSRIDSLTEQYLLKILRTPNRIGLGYFQTALDYLKTKNTQLSIQFDMTDNTASAPEVQELGMEDFLERYFYPLFAFPDDAPERRLFRRTLFANPIRSVVQVLYGLTKGREQSITYLNNVFFVSLQRLGFQQPDTLAEVLSTPSGIDLIMRQLFTHGFVAQGLELLPQLGSDEKNNALLTLHVELTEAMRKNVTVLLAYLLKACMLREVLSTQFPELLKKEYLTIENFLKIGNGESTVSTTERISVLNCGSISINQATKYQGTIILYRRLSPSSKYKFITKMYPDIINHPHSKIQLDENTFKNNYPDIYGFYQFENINDMPLLKQVSILINTPDDLASAMHSWQKNIINLGILDIQEGNQKFRIFSIFPLIGILEDFIENSQFIRMFFTQYKEISNYNTYCRQDTILQNEDDISDDIFTDKIGAIKHFHEGNLFMHHQLLYWAKFYIDNNSQLQLSPLLCSRIMKRFFVSLRNINSEISTGKTFIGMYIHRCLVAFFNSILVEEILLGPLSLNKNSIINLENPIINDRIFVNNYSRIYDFAIRAEKNNIRKFFHKILPLFTFVFSCPFWGLYLKSRDENGNEIPNEAYAEYMKFQDGDKKRLQEAYKVVLIYGRNRKEFSNLYYPLNSLAIQRK